MSSTVDRILWRDPGLGASLDAMELPSSAHDRRSLRADSKESSPGGPIVTVLLSVHNGEAFIREAVDSILMQSYQAFEMIIIDDASSDATPAILARLRDGRIRLFRNEHNIGLTRSLNRGLSLARGVYIARQDADDLSYPDRLAMQVRFLTEHADAALVGTQYRVIDARGSVAFGAADYRAQTPLAVQCQLLFANPFVHTSVMFRRTTVCDELGGYDERYVTSQDFELWSRLLAVHPCYNLGIRLVDYRVHKNSTGAAQGEAGVESRRDNRERNKAVQRRNIRRILGDDELAAIWPDVWMPFSTSGIAGAPEDPSRVLSLLSALYSRFIARYPAARYDLEVRRTYAAALITAARGLMQYDRIVATRALAQASILSPAIAARVGPRLAGVALGAATVRAAMNKLFSH